jgi:hypothetical protein
MNAAKAANLRKRLLAFMGVYLSIFVCVRLRAWFGILITRGLGSIMMAALRFVTLGICRV